MVMYIFQECNQLVCLCFSELYEICVSRAADRIRQMDESSDAPGSVESMTTLLTLCMLGG